MPLDIFALRDRLLIADGDTRGELRARGWKHRDCCELANLEKPDWVRDIAESFLDAGSEILVANTEAANFLALADGETDFSSDEVAEMARRGADICRTAVDDFPAKDRLVFGAVGPVRQLLMLGEVTEGDLASAYEHQTKALANGGVDAVLFRGFTELAALQIAVRAAGETKLPVIAAMAFDAGADQTETTLGVTVPHMCAALGAQPPPTVMARGAGPPSAVLAALGCDGGLAPDAAPKVVSLFKQSCKFPIWCAINAGLPQLIEGRAVYPESPEDFAERLKPLASAGANMIAGRRGVTPAHIAALGKAIRRTRRRQG